MSRFPIYEDDIILVDGEMYEEHLFLHAEYKQERFTKTIYKQLLEIWMDIQEALKERNVDYVFSCVAKEELILKWQGMFGMSPIIETETHYVYRREL